ncbi:MAG: bifunctional hydroxymethylpyrimidine kinase/phosphomethylpyrimidine kinase [Smithella sp.]
MMKSVKVLCIGGSDSSGGAGIQADLKAVSARVCWGLSVITAVTAQNTNGVFGIYPIAPEFVGKQMDVVLKDTGADAVKTGMLPTAEIIHAVAKKIKKYKITKLIVDPVMIAKGGKNLMPGKARLALIKELLPLALAVTPNIPEAEILAKTEIKSIEDMKEAALRIHDLGVRNVLIKGGHLPAGRKADVTDILYNGNFYEFTSQRIPVQNIHGTGCAYASALAAGIAQGESIIDAALRAKIFIIAAIKNHVQTGKGYSPANVFGEIFKRQ